MNSVIVKKYIFVFAFLAAAAFSFAQNIRVIGVIPKSGTDKLYQLQIGAYRLAANTDRSAAVLTRNGFTPMYEQRNGLTRVFVVVPAAEVRSAVDRLGRAGFREVVIREYAAAAAPPAPPKPVEPAPVPDPVELIPEEIILEEPEVVEVIPEEAPDIIPAAEEVIVEEPPAMEPPVEYEEFIFEAEEPEHELMHLYYAP